VNKNLSEVENMYFFTGDAAYVQMGNFAASIKQNFNVEDCVIYEEKTGENVWLGLQIQKYSKTFFVKLRYAVNNTGDLILQNKWWIVVEQNQEIANLPSLREVFHLLKIKNI
jgi:hypothetical protein